VKRWYPVGRPEAETRRKDSLYKQVTTGKLLRDNSLVSAG